MRVLLLTVVAALAANGACAAEIYKWTDESGVVHFGSEKPESVDAQAVKLRGAPSSDKESAPEVAGPDQAQPTGESELDKRNREQRRELCNRSMDSLNAMTSGQRVVKTNTDGTQSILSGGDLQASIEQARKNVETHCDPISP